MLRRRRRILLFRYSFFFCFRFIFIFVDVLVLFLLFLGLMSFEGFVIDYVRRIMYWTDSGLDKIERVRLDGFERKVFFYTDLVNFRVIVVDFIRGLVGFFVLFFVVFDS